MTVLLCPRQQLEIFSDAALHRQMRSGIYGMLSWGLRFQLASSPWFSVVYTISKKPPQAGGFFSCY